MKYERPELDIVEFDVVDIIQTSASTTDEDVEDKLPFLPATVSELDKNY